MSKPEGSWDKAQKRRVKMIGGQRRRVTCAELGLPEHLWTEEGSRKAAREYFARLQAELITDRYAEHPEHKLLSSTIDAKTAAGDDEEELQELEEHLKEAARRPSGATREDTELERKTRRQLEELLDVDLSHVPQLILTKLIERDAVKTVTTKPKTVDTKRELKHLVEVYMQQRRATESKGLIQPTTTEFDKYNLRRFVEHFPKGFTIDSIGYEAWHEWGEYCVSYSKQPKKNRTAISTLLASRTFMKWLLKTERITKLPTNFDEHKIKKELNEPETFSDEHLKLILSSADDELLCYILLALNTGANQIDVAELTYAMTAKDLGLWEGKQIRRKRVKTQKHETVPKVRYVLWQRTADLIEQFRKKGEHVFLNSDGGLLVSRKRGPDGKLKNNNSLGLRFSRFLESIGLKTGSYKTLRATSASKLGNNKDYRIFGPLFLDHAPSTVFEQSYLAEDCKALNEGVAWLETEFFG